MRNGKYHSAALLGLICLSSSLWIDSAAAKPNKHPKTETQLERPISPVSRPRLPGIGSTTQLTTLSSSQRSMLSDLLRGRSSRNDLLSSDLRSQIGSQISSLPPGIQKQLARGKRLPPGIAKKLLLPRQVNSYLNLPAQYDLVVFGSNVAVLDSVTQVVTDLITQVL